MNSAPPIRICLVGCGKMGGALLRGWVNADLDVEFSVIDPYAPQAQFKTIDEAASAIAQAALIILAVKPQMMNDICATLKPHITSKAALLSIAAGTSISNFEDHFGPSQPIIRTMPNTPAAIGKGATVGVTNAQVTKTQKDLATTLLSCTGLFEWVEDEALMNAVTALSGSGPAYVFHLIEVLSKAGQEAGLPHELSQALARQTVIGSAALAGSEADTPASVLRENVTSPGGTTAAALEVLMNGDLDRIYKQALSAAVKRGQALES